MGEEESELVCWSIEKVMVVDVARIKWFGSVSESYIFNFFFFKIILLPSEVIADAKHLVRMVAKECIPVCAF